MDGRRSFPEDQESSWYSGDRGYGDPDWRADGEDRYRGDDFRAPEQRVDTGERRYGDLTDPPASRYADSGRFGTGDPLGVDRSETESYRASRSRHVGTSASDITGSDLRGDRVSRASRAGRSVGEAEPLTPYRDGDPYRESDSFRDGALFRDEVDFRDEADAPDRTRGVDPGRPSPLGGYPIVEPSRNGDGGRTSAVRSADPGRGVDRGRGTEPGRGVDAGRGADLGHGTEAGRGVDAGRAVEAGRGVEGGLGPDAGRSVEVVLGPDTGRGVDDGPVDVRPHPLEMPTGPMPPVGPRPDLPPPGGEPLAFPPAGLVGRPGPATGDGVYRTRRPALAVLIALVVLIFEVPALRVLLHGLTADPVPVSHAVVGIFLVGGLPIFGAGLYGLRTGGLALADGSRGWLRPPTAYLTVGLVLFLAAALAAG